MNKFLHKFIYIVASICVIFPLILALHGRLGNPSEKDMNYPIWSNSGPFEQRGRFALTYSIVENGSLFFSLPVADFATPDLGYINGKYVSLFAPGVAFLAIPAYIIGRHFGISQLAVFSLSTIFALFNFFLIYKISRKLNISNHFSWLSGLVFIFATPAFAYSTDLYQHHISTFLLLACIYLYLYFNTFLSITLIWFLCAASIPIDYPNLFLMFPVGLMSLGKIISLKYSAAKLTLRVNAKRIFSFLSVILPLSFFLWFNNASYGDPLQFSGTVAQVTVIDDNGLPAKTSSDGLVVYESTDKTQSALSFFWTRNILSGFYIHLVSLDRGILIYTPVLIFGLLILFLSARKYNLGKEITFIFITTIGINLIMYSMWGDPWGGWAFGSRYLIPSYAILSILSVWALYQMRQSRLLRVLFFIFFYYSVLINSLGAITTNLVPPQKEVAGLELQTNRKERYSIDRNFNNLIEGSSKSFMFNQLVYNYLTPGQFWFLVSAFPLLTSVVIIFYLHKYGN